MTKKNCQSVADGIFLRAPGSVTPCWIAPIFSPSDASRIGITSGVWLLVPRGVDSNYKNAVGATGTSKRSHNACSCCCCCCRGYRLSLSSSLKTVGGILMHRRRWSRHGGRGPASNVRLLVTILQACFIQSFKLHFENWWKQESLNMRNDW